MADGEDLKETLEDAPEEEEPGKETIEEAGSAESQDEDAGSDEAHAEETAQEPENAVELPPEGFVHRYWMISLGLLLAVIGIIGMLALRLNFAQVYIFGDSNPYTGIGTEEPLGHFVSLVPFALGIILVIVWGLKTKPLPEADERTDDENGVKPGGNQTETKPAGL